MNKKVLHMHLIEMHLEKYHPGFGVLSLIILNLLFLALVYFCLRVEPCPALPSKAQTTDAQRGKAFHCMAFIGSP